MSWPRPAIEGVMHGRPRRVGRHLGIVLLLASWGSGPAPAQANSAGSPGLTTAAIVQQMVVRNQQRAAELGPYTSQRHYHIAYRGFPHGAEADMVVDVTCDGPSSKTFRIVSQSGSKLLIDHVLTRLLRTEKDDAASRSDSALTPANYNFTLIGSDTVNGRQTYALKVEPKERRPLLYRGTIWVDARDFAVVQIDAQPAKNPSFWIRDTEIHHVYSETGEFWLPQSNKTETKVRLGGTALLTIQYGTYNFSHTGDFATTLAEDRSKH
jgi:hypothetical protein